MRPSNSSNHQKIQAYIASNNLDAAAQLCTDALRQHSSDSDLWSDLSQISLRTGQNKMAINAALKAIDCAPDDVLQVFNLIGCYLHLQIFSAAKKALLRAEELLGVNDVKGACRDANLLNKLGELHYAANHLDAAVSAHKRVLAFDSENVAASNHLAALLRFKGDLPAAERLYRKVIQLQPDNYHACYNLAQLRRHDDAQALIALTEHCQQKLPADHQGHIMLQYALGKVYEDGGDYQQAFEHFSSGAALKRQQRAYDVNRDLGFMQAILGFFDQYEPVPKETIKPSNQVPIFVLGLPRTGTTLVERIIASHSEVVSGDELNALPMALLEAGGRPIAAGLDGLDETLVQALTPERMQWLGERYIELANNYVEAAPKFIDKLPYNFMYCGFILHALPQAKIIHVKRNPFDAGLSNFKMLFDRGYEYSYKQEDTAEFIAGYERMMKQWKQRFPENIHTIEYEQLIANQRQETEQVLAFCDLPWQDACLDFHNNQTATHTASASQVREPLHSRSIHLWTHYREQLSPMLNTLAVQGFEPSEFEDAEC